MASRNHCFCGFRRGKAALSHNERGAEGKGVCYHPSSYHFPYLYSRAASSPQGTATPPSSPITHYRARRSFILAFLTIRIARPYFWHLCRPSPPTEAGGEGGSPCMASREAAARDQYVGLACILAAAAPTRCCVTLASLAFRHVSVWSFFPYL